MKKNSVKRFEIYLYDFGETTGSIQAGKRPVLVIQDDRFNAHSPTTMVATITSAIKKQYLPSHVFLGEQFGLTKPSMVMIEQSRTVNQDELGTYIGTITDESMKRTLAKAIKKTFGLWSYEPKDASSVRCLCPQCMESYNPVGAIPEMLAVDTDRPCGVLVEPKNVEQLREAIFRLLQDDKEALQLAQRASMRVREEYSIDKVWNLLLGLWKSMK